MKATSMSINLAGGCTARCPFCIAKMTYQTPDNNGSLMASLPRAWRYAERNGIDTVMITGRGEPTISPSFSAVVNQAWDHGIPVIEVQTNGWWVGEPRGNAWKNLTMPALSTVAISLASIDPIKSASIMGLFVDLYKLPEDVKTLQTQHRKMVRLCLNLTKFDDPDDILAWCKEWADRGINQITLHELSVPDNALNADTNGKWISNNRMPEYRRESLARRVRELGTPMRSLGYGTTVYDLFGASVIVNECATDDPGLAEPRSVILQSDGHMYHSWNHTGSIIW